MKYTTLLFDLDGTLTNSKEGVARCIRYALARMGVSHGELDDDSFIGPPLRDSFRRILGGEARVEEAVALYRERYGEKGAFENALYPGVTGMLETLNENGFSLMVATSKAEPYVGKILGHFGLSGFFRFVAGATPDGSRERKEDVIRYVVAQTGTDPSRALMIGDRNHDLLGARENGMDGLGVLYGYGSREELGVCGPVFLAETPAGVAAYLV